MRILQSIRLAPLPRITPGHLLPLGTMGISIAFMVILGVGAGHFNTAPNTSLSGVYAAPSAIVELVQTASENSLESDELGAVIHGKGRDIWGQIHIAQPVYHKGGLWEMFAGPDETFTGDHPLLMLQRYMGSETRIDLKILDREIPLYSDELFKQPILIITGGEKITFYESERRNLRKYLLERGGFLLVDAAALDTDGELISSMKRMLRFTLPEYQIEPIPSYNEIYSYIYDVPAPPPGHAETEGKEYLEGIFVGDRLAVMLSERSFCTPVQNEHIPDAFRFAVNVLVYAVTHGEIADCSDYKP